MNKTNKVLIVDDDSNIQNALKESFRCLGHKPDIISVKSIKDLQLELNNIIAGQYDYILMDRNINGGKTDDIVAFLLLQSIETPIVSISSEEDQSEHFKIMKLKKPINLYAIETLINEYNDGTLQKNRQAGITTRQELVRTLK